MCTNHECGVHGSGRKVRGVDDRRASARARTPLAALAARGRHWLVTWLRRARSRARLRRELERLDAHLLHDIGGRREDLVREAYRPFWRA